MCRQKMPCFTGVGESRKDSMTRWQRFRIRVFWMMHQIGRWVMACGYGW